VYIAIFFSGMPLQDKYMDCTNSYGSTSLVYFHWFTLSRWENESYIVDRIFGGQAGSTRNGTIASLSLVEIQLIVYFLPACLSETTYF